VRGFAIFFKKVKNKRLNQQILTMKTFHGWIWIPRAQTHQQNVYTDVATVSLPYGPRESSQAQNPPVESTRVEDVDDDSESES
jgi:hypothetical protein